MQNKVKQIIDEQCLSLNSAIVSKLNQARHKAIDAENTKVEFSILKFLPLAAVIAFGITIIFQVTQNQNHGVSIPEQQLVISELEIIEQIELVENLEFYEWLSHEDDVSSI